MHAIYSSDITPKQTLEQNAHRQNTFTKSLNRDIPNLTFLNSTTIYKMLIKYVGSSVLLAPRILPT